MTERDAYCLAYGAVVAQLRGVRSQGDIAKAAGMTQTILSRIERGVASVNGWEHRHLATALGVTGTELSQCVDAALHRASVVVEQLAAGGIVERPAKWYEVVPDRDGIAGLIVFAAALVHP